MGLFSGRNMRKAKSLLDKNRHKVGGMVDKATDQVDKVSKGKTAGVTSKLDQAAHKFSGTDAEQPDDQTGSEPTESTDDVEPETAE